MHIIRTSTACGLIVTGCFYLPPCEKAGAAEKASQAKILDALTSLTEIEFTDVPLSDCVEYLADYHDIPILLDEAALRQVKVGGTTPVSYQSKQQGDSVHLFRALWEMLGKSDVSFMIDDRGLVITSATKARPWQADFTKSIEPQLRRGKK